VIESSSADQLPASLGRRALGAESTVHLRLFVAATATAKKDRENFTRDDAVLAQYGE
jgi:hypothetical protein